MQYKKIILLCLVFLIKPAVADNYFSVLYMPVIYNYSNDSIDDLIATGSLQFAVGKKLAQRFSIEGRLSVPLVSQEESVITSSSSVNIEYDTSHVGILAKYGHSFYGAVAFTKLERETSIQGDLSLVPSGVNTTPFDESGFGIGIGYQTPTRRGFMAELLVGTGDLDDVILLSMGYHSRF